MAYIYELSLPISRDETVARLESLIAGPNKPGGPFNTVIADKAIPRVFMGNTEEMRDYVRVFWRIGESGFGSILTQCDVFSIDKNQSTLKVEFTEGPGLFFKISAVFAVLVTLFGIYTENILWIGFGGISALISLFKCVMEPIDRRFVLKKLQHLFSDYPSTLKKLEG